MTKPLQSAECSSPKHFKRTSKRSFGSNDLALVPEKCAWVVQLGDISIRPFQYGGVCLHFRRAGLNTVCGKSNFKITLIFSEMTIYFNYII